MMYALYLLCAAAVEGGAVSGLAAAATAAAAVVSAAIVTWYVTNLKGTVSAIIIDALETT